MGIYTLKAHLSFESDGPQGAGRNTIPGSRSEWDQGGVASSAREERACDTEARKD